MTISSQIKAEPASESLLVVDFRTAKSYSIPIKGNTVQATELGRITAPEIGNGKSENGVAGIDYSHPLRVLDTGFENTACMESSITYIDGKQGVILYRDLPIEDLFKNYVFEDVMHLLIWGELPSLQQKDDVRTIMSSAANPPETVMNVVSAFPKDSETCNMVIAGMSAFGASDKIMTATHHQQKPMFWGNPEAADKALLRTIQYFTTTVALVYCHKRGKKFTPPQPHRSLIGNLLLMMGFIDPASGSDSRPETILNKLWILYADNEMTHSTAAVLHTASSLTDPVSIAIAGITAGYGPLHGGAIELAYEAFSQIGTPENVGPFMEMVKAKKARLFGYGHRIFKTRDPRAPLIKEIMPTEEGLSNPLLHIALAVDRVARTDPYFIERGLHANVDLYGSFPYAALGFDKDIITAVIILSRFPGALAHWRESLVQPVKLWRPHQSYTPKATEKVSNGASNGNGVKEAEKPFNEVLNARTMEVGA